MPQKPKASGQPNKTHVASLEVCTSSFPPVEERLSDNQRDASRISPPTRHVRHQTQTCHVCLHSFSGQHTSHSLLLGVCVCVVFLNAQNSVVKPTLFYVAVHRSVYKGFLSAGGIKACQKLSHYIRTLSVENAIRCNIILMPNILMTEAMHLYGCGSVIGYLHYIACRKGSAPNISS